MGSTLEKKAAAYAEFAIVNRILVCSLVTVLFAITAFGLPKLAFDTRYRIWFQEGSAALKAYDSLLERFGSDDQILIVFRDAENGLMNNKSLSSVRRLTDEFWKIEGVKRVDSLANYSSTKASSIDNESPALAVSKRFLAAAGNKNDIYLWDLENLTKRRLTGHSGAVEHLVFSPDGKHLFSGSIDRTVRIWDLETDAEPQVLLGHSQGISKLALSNDGRQLAVGSYQNLYLWDLDAKQLRHTLGGHSDYVTAIAWSKGVEQLVSSSKSIFVWDTKSGKLVYRHEGGPRLINDLELVDQGRFVVFASDTGAVLRWEIKTNEILELLPEDRSRTVLTLSRMPNVNTVVGGLSDGSVRTFPVDGSIGVVSRIHNDWVVDLAVDEKGRVFSGARDKNVGVHIPGQGPQIVTLAAHRASVRRVIVGPSGRLFTSGDDGDVYVWSKDLVLQARLPRSHEQEIREPVKIEGTGRGKLAIENGFRYPVTVYVDGELRAKLDGGSSYAVENIPVSDRSACEDDSNCGPGQYCDYEQEEPVCSGTSVIEARVEGQGRPVWRGEAFLVENGTVSVRIPSDEPFSVEESMKSPISEKGLVSNFLKTFPDPAVKELLSQVEGNIAEHPNAFIAPHVARKMEELIPAEGFPENAQNWLSSQAQLKLSPLQDPVQPYRIREATYHLMREPDPSARGLVLNQALDTTMILVSLHQPDQAKASERGRQIGDQVRAILADEAKRTKYTYHLSGGVVMDSTMADYAIRDWNQLTPVFLIVIVILLIATYRRLSGVFLPLGLVTISICIAMGFAGLVGASLNNLTVAVPQVVLASCIGDAVHIFNAYIDNVKTGQSSREATIASIRDNFMPCFWTSASTSIGFFSLAISPILPVAAFGWMSGVGVICAFMLSLTVMPAITSMLPVPKQYQNPSPQESTETSGTNSLFDRKLISLSAWVNGNTGVILFFSAIVLGFGGYGLTKVEIDTSELKFFSKESDFRQAAEFLEDNLSGAYNLSFMVTFTDPKTGKPVPGAIRKKENIAKIEKLHQYLKSKPGVVSVVSLASTMKSMNRVMRNDLSDDFRLPENDAKVTSYYNAYTFSLSAGRDITNQVSADESATLVDVRLMSEPASWFMKFGDEVNAWTSENLTGADAKIAAKSWLYLNMVRDVASGFIENVGSAVVLISFMLFFLAGSFRLGLPTSMANIVPILLTVGFVSLFNMQLDVSVLMSCCVALGVVVDDTTHFISKYKNALDAGYSHEKAVEKTILVSGKAMIITTVILCCAFLMFTLTDFVLNRNFGVIVATMLFIGMAFDLTILPVTLGLGRRKQAAGEKAVA